MGTAPAGVARAASVDPRPARARAHRPGLLAALHDRTHAARRRPAGRRSADPLPARRQPPGLRAVEECPKALQPLADCNIAACCGRTRTAVTGRSPASCKVQTAAWASRSAATPPRGKLCGRALLKLAYEPVARPAEGSAAEGAFFDELLNPDQARRLLLWMNDPTGYPSSLTPAEWYAFCELCKRNYGFHPVDDGALMAAERLGTRRAPGRSSGTDSTRTPEGYPNLPELLRRARPEQSIFEKSLPYWPQDNETAEEDLRAALLALDDAAPADARDGIARA